MKNFPHQISSWPRLREALTVFAALIAEGADPTDDGIVGRRLAREGVYAFRDKSLDLETALELEARKPKGSQGTRTVARDLRRLFTLLGFLTPDPVRLSASGQALLGAAGGSEAEADLVRSALRHMKLDDAEGSSTPYRLMLRLVEGEPGIDTNKLALALEANDDSPEEFDRISRLARSEDWEEQLARSGVSDHMIKNAVKILPALARQLGDLRTMPSGANYLGSERSTERIAEDATASSDPARSPRRRHRRVTAATIAALRTDDETKGDPAEHADPDETRELRAQRLDRHQRMVRKFAQQMERAGFRLSEDPYDLLAERADSSVLAEMKTIDPDRSDERAQIRRALGQLQYYAHFDCEPAGEIIMLCVVEAEPSREHIEFLEAHGVLTLWSTESGWAGMPTAVGALSGVGLALGLE